jgi:hypothetical protein
VVVMIAPWVLSDRLDVLVDRVGTGNSSLAATRIFIPPEARRHAILGYLRPGG